MIIKLHKDFAKQVAALRPAQQNRLHQALKLFQKQPGHHDLYNHALTGQWRGHRSIAFGGDWRAHYKVVDGAAVFVAVGTHSQLYK